MWSPHSSEYWKESARERYLRYIIIIIIIGEKDRRMEDANKKISCKNDKELKSKLPVRAELAWPCPWALSGMLGALNLRMLEKGDEKDTQTRKRIDMK